MSFVDALKPLAHHDLVAVLLILILTSPVMIHCRSHDRSFDSYDCSRPLAMEDRALFDQQLPCDVPHRALHTAHNQSFQLLVHEPIMRLKGYKCEVYDNRKVVYCGNSDHQTMYDRYDYSMIPKSPLPTECNRMVSQGKFTLPDKTEVDVEMGKVNIFHWTEVGRTYTGYDTFSPGKQVKCQGGNWRTGSEDLEDMVVTHRMRVVITEEEFRFDGEVLRAVSDGTNLACGPYAENCQNEEASYTWKADHNWCPLANSKHVSGMVIDDERGEKVFMSNDGSLVRLVMTYQESQCERMVWATNYPNIFLAKLPSRLPFRRPVNPTAVSLSTYVNNRDDFLYATMIDQINQELSSVLVHDCMQQRKRSRSDYMLAHKIPGLETFTLGNGTFATAAGEVMWYHRCEHVITTAKELDECYNALPVNLPPNHRLKQEDPQQQWFLERLTHRLVKYATPMPCSKVYAPKYKTRHGQWVTVDPQVRTTSAPKPTDTPKEIVRSLTKIHDFSIGGVYSEAELKAMEDWVNMPLAREALAGYLGQVYTDGYRKDVPALAMNPYGVGPKAWLEEQAGYFLTFLKYWGDAAAIFISVLFFLNLGKRLVEGIMNVRNVYQQQFGWVTKMLYCLCPTSMLLRESRLRREAADERLIDEEPDVETMTNASSTIVKHPRGRSPRARSPDKSLPGYAPLHASTTSSMDHRRNTHSPGPHTGAVSRLSAAGRAAQAVGRAAQAVHRFQTMQHDDADDYFQEQS